LEHISLSDRLTLQDQPLAARLSAPADEQPVELLVARVERHLAEDPEDGQGWAVIAPVYMRMGQPDSAARAYSNAIRILGPRPDWLTDMGEAMTVSNEGVITELARTAFQQAVDLEPTAVKPQVLSCSGADPGRERGMRPSMLGRPFLKGLILRRHGCRSRGGNWLV
jgi:cytochrome c-type biogenesis protein CcmH/NrfG